MAFVELVKNEMIIVDKDKRCFGCLGRIESGTKAKLWEYKINMLNNTQNKDIYLCETCNKYVESRCSKCKLCGDVYRENFVDKCLNKEI